LIEDKLEDDLEKAHVVGAPANSMSFVLLTAFASRYRTLPRSPLLSYVFLYLHRECESFIIRSLVRKAYGGTLFCLRFDVFEFLEKRGKTLDLFVLGQTSHLMTLK
jgi:hypothetical protein